MNEWTNKQANENTDENMAKELRAFYKHTNLKVGSVCSDENEHYDRERLYYTLHQHYGTQRATTDQATISL